MANSPVNGLYYPTAATAADVPAEMKKLVDTLDGRIVKPYASAAARDTAFSSLSNAQKASALVYVAGRGWTGHNGTTWVDFSTNPVKGGLLTTVVEGNGHARIPSAQCFFDGAQPSAVVATGFSPNDTITFSLFDGGGALMRVFNASTHVQAPAGTQVAFMWIAIRGTS